MSGDEPLTVVPLSGVKKLHTLVDLGWAGAITYCQCGGKRWELAPDVNTILCIECGGLYRCTIEIAEEHGGS